MQAVRDAGHNIIGKTMTLLGAGGAATAISVQAALDGVANINIFSIRDQFFDRAQKTVDLINSNTNCHAALYDLADDSELRRALRPAIF